LSRIVAIPQIIRKTESTFFGAWLLDSAALAALDEIIHEQQQRLEEHRKRQIEKATRLRRDRHRKSVSDSERSADQKVEDKEIRHQVEIEYPAAVRIITLTLSSGDKVRVSSFREAADDVTFKGHEVTKVEVGLRCADIRGDLVGPTPDKNHGLSLITLPEASEPADELFVRLNQWAEQFKPGFLRRLQSLPSGLLVIFAGALMIMVAMLGIITRAIPTKNSWRTEARELVAKGLKPEDHSRALELLLRYSAGLDTDVEFSQIPAWYKVTFVTAMVVAMLLSFGGDTAFEIGRGAARVRRQKVHSAFLRRTLAFLIYGVMASILGSFAFNYIWPK
jgi:hypothetical protein